MPIFPRVWWGLIIAATAFFFGAHDISIGGIFLITLGINLIIYSRYHCCDRRIWRSTLVICAYVVILEEPCSNASSFFKFGLLDDLWKKLDLFAGLNGRICVLALLLNLKLIWSADDTFYRLAALLFLQSKAAPLMSRTLSFWGNRIATRILRQSGGFSDLTSQTLIPIYARVIFFILLDGRQVVIIALRGYRSPAYWCSVDTSIIRSCFQFFPRCRSEHIVII